jgi:hypothetical protein
VPDSFYLSFVKKILLHCPLFDFGKWFLKIVTQSWLLQDRLKKGRDVPVNSMKATRGVEVWLHTFFISTLDEGEW